MEVAGLQNLLSGPGLEANAPRDKEDPDIQVHVER